MDTKEQAVGFGQQGIWSPPEPLPNAADLGMGRYSHNFNVLNMLDATCLRQWNQVVDWFKLKGAPIANEMFFTAYTNSMDGGPFAPTAVVFIDATGNSIMFDATICFNEPAVHLQQLEAYFKFGNPGVTEVFPGFETIDASNADPVGSPLPNKNTPGWTREFSRYYDVNGNYNPTRHVPGFRFERLNGEQYEMNNILGSPRGGGPFSGFTSIPVWQRLR